MARAVAGTPVTLERFGSVCSQTSISGSASRAAPRGVVSSGNGGVRIAANATSFGS
jgi:hypothetical protein